MEEAAAAACARCGSTASAIQVEKSLLIRSLGVCSAPALFKLRCGIELTSRTQWRVLVDSCFR